MMRHALAGPAAIAGTGVLEELRIGVPHHAPLVHVLRDGLVESVHEGSVIALAPDGSTLFAAGDPDSYPCLEQGFADVPADESVAAEDRYQLFLGIKHGLALAPPARR